MLSKLTPNVLIAWSVLTVTLVAMADIPGLGDVAAALAWLLFLSLALIYGEKALTGIAKLYSRPDERNTPIAHQP